MELNELQAYIKKHTPQSFKKGGSVKKYQDGGLTEDLDKARRKAARREIYDGIGLGAGIVGGGLTALANQPDSQPNQFASIGGTALQGIQAGAALGPIGMAGGALLGGLAGYGSYMKRQEELDAQNYLKQKQYMENSTMDQNRGYYQEGGVIDPDPTKPNNLVKVKNPLYQDSLDLHNYTTKYHENIKEQVNKYGRTYFPEGDIIRPKVRSYYDNYIKSLIAYSNLASANNEKPKMMSGDEDRLYTYRNGDKDTTLSTGNYKKPTTPYIEVEGNTEWLTPTIKKIQNKQDYKYQPILGNNQVSTPDIAPNPLNIQYFNNGVQVGDPVYHEYQNKFPEHKQQGGQVETNQEVPIIKEGGSYFIPPMPTPLNYVDPKSPFQHVQTEKGEKVMMQDGGIVPVKALKLHKDIKKDEVTDILPAGSYVMSDFGKMKLKKDKLEKIVLGHGPVEYEEGESDDPIKEVKMSDFMNKKEMSPAEITENILKKYPLSSRKKDIFADVTNEHNTINRLPFLAKLIELNESKKKKPVSDDAEMFKMGGSVKKYQTLGEILVNGKKVEVPVPIQSSDAFNPNLPTGINSLDAILQGPSLQSPDLPYGVNGLDAIKLGISQGRGVLNSPNADIVIPPMLPGGFQISPFKKPYTKDDALAPSGDETNPLSSQYLSLIDNYKTQFGNNNTYSRVASGAAHGLGALGSALQSAEVDPTLKGTKYLRQSFQKVPQYLKDQQISQSQKPLDTLARNLGRNGYNGNQLQALLSGATARTQDAVNKSMTQYNLNDVSQDQGYNRALQGVTDFNSAALAQAGNDKRGLENARLARALGYISQGLTKDASLRGKNVESQFALDKEAIGFQQRQLDAAKQAEMMKQMLSTLYANKQG